MIETVLNLLFNCTHRHLTRPFTPVNVAHGETYVVCLDCGKQFAYDLNTMHIGKVIEQTHDHCVVHAAHQRKSKLKYVLAGAGVPLAVLLGSRLAARTLNRGKKS
jgi:hypothetical protein